VQISVIIPTYNRVAMLGRAIDSVLAQTTPADEIIVVDDGSDDDTKIFVGACYPQITYLYQAHAGVSAARNHGFRFADGDWMALLDSDDAWQPTKLTEQLALARQSPELRLIHSDELWFRNGKPLAQQDHHRKRGGWIFDDCLPRCVISPSAVLLRRELIQQHQGCDEQLPACEDYDLWLRVCAHEPVGFVETPLVRKYGGHADQLSRTVPALDQYRIKVLARLIDDGLLNDEQVEATRATLARKLNIYISGARRRGHQQEVRQHVDLQCRLNL